MNAGRAIAALLLGLGIFGFLRARTVVSDTWGIRSGRPLLAPASVGIALVALLIVAPSMFGVIAVATVLAVILYGGWRLRRD